MTEFGLVIPVELHDPSLRGTFLGAVNRLLERAAGHFQSAWVVDHLQFEDRGVLESFTTLAHLAARHADWWNVSSTEIDPFLRMSAELDLFILDPSGFPDLACLDLLVREVLPAL